MSAVEANENGNLASENSDRLRTATTNLSEALVIAADRLEAAGLRHEDLREVIATAARMLGDGGASASQTFADVVGPIVFGSPASPPGFPSPMRFAFDAGANRLLRLQFGGGDGWVESTMAQRDALYGWLMEEADDMIDHPQNWGMESADLPPTWARE